MAAPTVHDIDCTLRSTYTDEFARARKNSTVKDKFEMPKRGKAKRRSQGFSFMRQKRSFLPDMQFQWSYTINPDFARDI